MDLGRRRPGAGHQRSARGSAAVEFALVTPVLLTILFGILQYGLYFNDSLTANEAVRAATRSAVVEKAPSSCTGTFGWSVVRCATSDALNRSDAAIRISAPNGWAEGNALTVCVQFPSRGGFGFVPLPDHGMVHAKLQMSIEETSLVPSGTGLSDAAPSGQDWSWC
ncbi:MAG: pilus assembly protein [Nocardioidaceae bacterium]|nr:pilus assembly protein [Nocardioidaceae bacterium]